MKRTPATKRTLLLLQIAVRDSRATKGAQRLLLDALVLRAKAETGWSCFPSYRRLALDTGLDETTLKRAAKKLEDAGLIRRQVRRNRSNVFFVAYDRLEELAAENKAKQALVEDSDPSYSTYSNSNNLDNLEP